MQADDLPDWQKKLKEDIGENPARFLDHRLVEYGEDHTDHTLARMVRDRITGIDRIEVVNAWIAVERKLDRGPRDPVISLLEDRREFLEENGERPTEWGTDWPHELPDRHRPRARDRQLPDKEWFLVERDRDGVVVNRTPFDEKRSDTATAKLNRVRDSEVATDGGESP